MEEQEIRSRIKEIISNVTNIPIEEIGDKDSFREVLDLDSLSLLEIGVDVDYEFKLGLPEEQLQKIGSVDEAVALAVKVLAEKAGKTEVA